MILGEINNYDAGQLKEIIKDLLADLKHKKIALKSRKEKIKELDSKWIKEYACLENLKNNQINELEQKIKQLNEGLEEYKSDCGMCDIQARKIIKRFVAWAESEHPKEYFDWIIKDAKKFLKE